MLLCRCPHLLDSLGLTRQVHFAQEWRQESINQIILCLAFFFSLSLSEVRTGEGRAGSHHSLQGWLGLCVLSQVKHFFFSNCVSQTTGVGGSWLWLLLFKTFNVQLNDGHRLAVLFLCLHCTNNRGLHLRITDQRSFLVLVTVLQGMQCTFFLLFRKKNPNLTT